MNTTSEKRPVLPPESAAWSALLQGSRHSDRCLARALCRCPEIRRSGGMYPALRTQSAAAIAAHLRLSRRQVERLLAGDSRLWHWCGDDLRLALAADAATQRAIREQAGRPATYPAEDEPPDLLAAEEDA